MSGSTPVRMIRDRVLPVVHVPEWLLHWMEGVVRGKPALAVPAYMVEDPGKLDSAGNAMTRAWLFQQWARIAAAGKAVRVVVVEGSVRVLQPGGPTYNDWVKALDDCRAAGQHVYGYVDAQHGKRPPADVANEVQEWKNNFGGHIDGIYLDNGPISCDAQVAAYYRTYSQHIRTLGLRLFILAPQWPDDATDAAGQPDPWLRSLNPDLIQLWEEGVTEYRMKYGALKYCTTQDVEPAPSWWTDTRGWLPGGPPSFRHATRRVHVINDCADAATMRQLIPEALAKGARTVWITKAGKHPLHGSVYDQLPTYWDEMVAFIGTL